MNYCRDRIQYSLQSIRYIFFNIYVTLSGHEIESSVTYANISLHSTNKPPVRISLSARRVEILNV